MTFLSRDRVRHIVNNRPEGTTPEGIVATLRSQGHILEGHASEEQSRSVGQFASNVVNSAGRLVGDTVRGLGQTALGLGVKAVETVSGADFDDPFGSETAVETLGRSAVGGVINAVETAATPFAAAVNAVAGTDLDPENLIDAPEVEEVASTLGKHFNDRTGVADLLRGDFQTAVKKLSDTFYQDPAGLLSDIALLATGAGGAVRGAGKVAGLSQVARAGKGIADAGRLAEPISGVATVTTKAAGTAGKFLQKPLQATSERLFQSALKPSKAVLDRFPKVVRTGIDEGIVVTKGSVDDVVEIMDEIDDAIGVKITSAGKKGVELATDDILTRIDDVKTFFQNSVGGSKSVDELDDLARLFRKEQGKTITAAKAQTLKKNTQQILRKSFGELKAAETEGRKAIARGLREELAQKIPELAELNARQKDLIGLHKALERFIGRSEGRDLLGLTGGVGAGAGGVTGGVTGALKGGLIAKIAKTIVDHPGAKSRIAIVLDRAAKGKSIPADVAEKIRSAAIKLRALSTTEDQ